MMATWDDVLARFADRKHPTAVIQRLCDEWADRTGADRVTVGPHLSVTRKVLSQRDVGEHLDRLAKLQPLLITDDNPRRLDGPLVLVDFGNGRIGQIDGRRRANVWRHMTGMYEALVLCAS